MSLPTPTNQVLLFSRLNTTLEVMESYIYRQAMLFSVLNREIVLESRLQMFSVDML
jgi:hypothetical protein